MRNLFDFLKLPEEMCSLVEKEGRSIASPSELKTHTTAMTFSRLLECVKDLKSRGVTHISIFGFSDIIIDALKGGIFSDIHIDAIYSDKVQEDLLTFRYGLIPVYRTDQFKTSISAIFFVVEDLAERALLPKGRVIEMIPPGADSIPFHVKDEWQDEYKILLNQLKSHIRNKLKSIINPDKTILFAGIYTYFNFNKFSTALRKKGFRTVFLCLNSSNQPYKNDHFDITINAHSNLEMFYWILSEFSFKLVHFQGWLNCHSFAAAASFCSKSPIVTEFNDIPHFIFDQKEYDSIFGEKSFKHEEKSIGYILEKSSGVIFNYQANSSKIVLDHYSHAPALMHFHSYPLPDFFASMDAEKSNQSIRIVFAGTLSPSYYPEGPFGDVKMLELIQIVIDQGLEFNVYINPYQKKTVKGVFWDYEYLAEKDSKFIIRDGIGPECLPNEICTMDYGCLFYKFPKEFTVKNEHISNIIPTKFFSYIEAGIPIIVCEEFTALVNIVEEHGLGVVVTQDDLFQLSSVIERFDYAMLSGNVQKYRELFSMDNKIDKLIQFYNSVG